MGASGVDQREQLVRVGFLERPALGVLLIGGILGWLWVEYGPPPVGRADDERPKVPRLADAAAVVTVHDGSGTRRASIACDGDRRPDDHSVSSSPARPPSH